MTWYETGVQIDTLKIRYMYLIIIQMQIKTISKRKTRRNC